MPAHETDPDPKKPDDVPAKQQVMEKLTECLERSGVNPRDLATLCHLRFGRGYAELYDRQAWTLLAYLWPNNGDQTRMRDAITRMCDYLMAQVPEEFRADS